jgi:hypothetical protein
MDSIFYLQKKKKMFYPNAFFSDHCDGWGSRCQSNVSCNLFSKKEEIFEEKKFDKKLD